MAQHTTKQKVQGLLETGFDWTAGKDLQPFIDSAVILVDRVEVCDGLANDVLSDAALELIERWLSAWFYKGPDPAYSSRSTAGASGAFSGTTAMYLEDNRYGQRAKALDFSGCLGSIVPGPDGMSKKVRGRWLGRRPSEQTAYRDRD